MALGNRCWVRSHSGDKCPLATSFLYPSVCQHNLTRLNTDGYLWNLILKTSIKLWRWLPNLVKIGQKYRTLYMETYVRLYYWQHYGIFCSSVRMQREPIVSYPWGHSNAIIDGDVGQQQRSNAFLLFRERLMFFFYVVHSDVSISPIHRTLCCRSVTRTNHSVRLFLHCLSCSFCCWTICRP